MAGINPTEYSIFPSFEDQFTEESFLSGYGREPDSLDETTVIERRISLLEKEKNPAKKRKVGDISKDVFEKHTSGSSKRSELSRTFSSPKDVKNELSKDREIAKLKQENRELLAKNAVLEAELKALKHRIVR